MDTVTITRKEWDSFCKRSDELDDIYSALHVNHVEITGENALDAINDKNERIKRLEDELKYYKQLVSDSNQAKMDLVNKQQAEYDKASGRK